MIITYFKLIVNQNNPSFWDCRRFIITYFKLIVNQNTREESRKHFIITYFKLIVNQNEIFILPSRKEL